MRLSIVLTVALAVSGHFTRPAHGLPLAKAFLDSYGATIQAESRTVEDDPAQCGTLFRVTFPSER